MDFNTFVANSGFDVETLTDTQRVALQAAWRKAEADPNDRGDGGGGKRVDPSYDETIARFKAEDQRVQRVTKLVAEAIEASPGRLDDLDAIGKQAIAGKWTETQTELALLRAARPGAPSVAGAGGSAQASAVVLEAALAQAAGLPDAEGHYGERAMEAAHKHYRGGMGLLQFLDVCARQNGYRGTAAAKSNLREVMQHAFDLRASAPSNISVSGILSNVANKFVRDSFNAVEQAWSRIAARRSVSDFKQVTTYSLTGDMAYQEIAPGGKLKHGTVGETSYTNQAKSYGRIAGLDRRDMINDDLGAFAGLNKKMGRGGGLKVSDVCWRTYLNNSTFFTSGNANVSTGAGSALSIAGLIAAETVFRTQTDPNGNLMGTLPKILLVPTALRATAWNLMNSTTTVATTTANAPLPDQNPFSGMFEVVDSAYMQNSAYTGYSATAWYLLADPADVPVIEVAFLDGKEMPTVESTDADFDTLGIQIRGYHDFGFALQEHRGGVRSAGS